MVNPYFVPKQCLILTKSDNGEASSDNHIAADSPACISFRAGLHDVSIWRQEKENMLMRYQSLTREAAARLMAGKKVNGFEKAMDVTDKFAGLVIKGKLPELTNAADTAELRK